MTDSIVLLSGGQDSTTCLAWALRHLGPVKTLSFDYGQKHRVELDVATAIADIFQVENEVLPVEALKILRGAALTNEDISVEAQASAESLNSHAFAHGLPSTFVPGRNLLFFTLAAAYGAKYGIYDLVTGVCEADDAGYPDCRSEFVYSAESTLTHALNEVVTIHAPLLFRSKKETFHLANELGILDVIVEETHTCYHGVRNIKHRWGRGCGTCPACLTREMGFDEAFGLVKHG